MAKQQRPKSTISPSTIVAILLVGFIPILFWMLMNPNLSGDYMFYQGPVLPLSSLSGAETVTAQRHVELDFANCSEPSDSVLDPNTVIVTDTYELTNTSAEAVTVELAWGFEGAFDDAPELIPAITADGQEVEAILYPSSDGNDGLTSAKSFEKYQKLLTEYDFLTTALSDTTHWEEPVKVYHFYNISHEGEVVPTLDIAYNYGKTTNIWVPTYGMTGYDNQEKQYHIAFNIDRDAWLYVMGDDLEDMTVGGSKVHTMGVYTAEEVEGLSYELETYESTFRECLWECAQRYRHEDGTELSPMVERITPEILYKCVMMNIEEGKYKNSVNHVRSMDSMFYGTVSGSRIFYWVFPVEIPAGETVTVTGIYEQEVSHNGSLDPSRNGFDLATTLGSNLSFTAQTATITNARNITIADEGESQNFGFDPANGITTVNLDMNTQRYYLDISLTEE